MKPAAFDYYAPSTAEEALAYLDQFGYDAKLLAGGQSLIPTMNFRLAQPSVLVDLNPIVDLSYIRPHEDGGLLLGAMTRASQAERDSLVAERAPLVHETMPSIAHPQIRNRTTMGGTMAHADPAAELPAVAMALNAQFRIQGQAGDRWVSVDEFFLGMFMTVIEPNELLVEVRLPPMPPRSGWCFREIARRHGDYALVGVAAMVTLNNEDQCDHARLVFLSVEDRPVPARRATEMLQGQTPTAEAIQAAAEAAATEDIDPGGDIHASASYRRQLAKVLARQTLTRAFDRARSAA